MKIQKLTAFLTYLMITTGIAAAGPVDKNSILVNTGSNFIQEFTLNPSNNPLLQEIPLDTTYPRSISNGNDFLNETMNHLKYSSICGTAGVNQVGFLDMIRQRLPGNTYTLGMSWFAPVKLGNYPAGWTHYRDTAAAPHGFVSLNVRDNITCIGSKMYTLKATASGGAIYGLSFSDPNFKSQFNTTNTFPIIPEAGTNGNIFVLNQVYAEPNGFALKGLKVTEYSPTGTPLGGLNIPFTSLPDYSLLKAADPMALAVDESALYFAYTVYNPDVYGSLFQKFTTYLVKILPNGKVDRAISIGESSIGDIQVRVDGQIIVSYSGLFFSADVSSYIGQFDTKFEPPTLGYTQVNGTLVRKWAASSKFGLAAGHIAPRADFANSLYDATKRITLNPSGKQLLPGDKDPSFTR